MKKIIILLTFIIVIGASLSVCIFAEDGHIHTEQILRQIPATCYSTGLTEGKICSDCQEILVIQQTVPTLPHNTDITLQGTPPTCTQDGRTEGKMCSVCNGISVAQVAIEKTGHTPVSIASISETCISVGYTDGVKCSVCDEVISAQSEIPINITRHFYDGKDDDICNGCGYDKSGTIIETNENQHKEKSGCKASVLGTLSVIFACAPALLCVFRKKQK